MRCCCDHVEDNVAVLLHPGAQDWLSDIQAQAAQWPQVVLEAYVLQTSEISHVHRGLRQLLPLRQLKCSMKQWLSDFFTERTLDNDDLCIAFQTNFQRFTIELDLQWAKKVMILLGKRRKLQEIAMWVSTLGGAHACLGDTSYAHADAAEELAKKQFMVAAALGDVRLAARCTLFVGYSAIQKGGCCWLRDDAD